MSELHRPNVVKDPAARQSAVWHQIARPRVSPRPGPVTLFCIRALLPGMLVHQTVGNQLWRIGPLFVGQIIFWCLAVLAAIIVWTTFWRRWWCPLLIVAPIAARLLRVFVGGQISELCYFAAVNAVFFVAATVTAYAYAELIRRQLNWFFYLSVPLMILQVAGAGSWTQALNTQYLPGVDVATDRSVYPTLFVKQEDIHYTVGQGRPAGFMHSNAVLSLVILLAFVLNAARTHDGRLRWGDVFVAAAIVLAMAKIVLLAFLLIILWVLVLEQAVLRRYAVRFVGLLLVLYATYGVFFPGLLARQLSAFQVFYSIFIRVHDLVRVLPIGEEQRAWIVESLAWSEKYTHAKYIYWSEEDVGNLSGYGRVIDYLPFIAGALVLAIPLLLKAYRELKKQPRDRRLASIFGTIVVITYPAAIPFWQAQLYWFVAGFAFLPVVLVLLRRPKRPNLIKRLHRSPSLAFDSVQPAG